MPPNFWGARLTTISPVIQQVKITPIAVQLPQQPELHQEVTAFPVKNVAFQQAILSHVVFNVDKNGPVITDAAVPFFSERSTQLKSGTFLNFASRRPYKIAFC